MWYWHTPFKLTDTDRQGLSEVGVKTLYVRAGTFASDGKDVSLILPQRWESPAKTLGVVLTYNFHPGLVRHLEELPKVRITSQVAEAVERSWKKAQSYSIQPKGVQFDVDCPTRLLPLYADLLKGIRISLKAHGVNGSFSTTALPTWLGSKNITALGNAVDFIVPQFYEGRTGQNVQLVYPVSDPDAIRQGLRKLNKLGIPCQVGLAAYGHALLYDDHGRLVSMYHGLSAEDALRHPALAPESSTPLASDGTEAKDEQNAAGEDRLLLKATGNDISGQGKGFRIAYLLPTPSMVTRQLAAFAESRPANARGIILYRFPEPQESMCLPLASVVAGMHGDKPAVLAKVLINTQAIPWKLIDAETTADRAPRDLRITLEGMGNSPSRASRDAVQLLVALNKPGIEGVAPGDFDEATPGIVDKAGRFTPCAPAQADSIRFRRYQLLPGDVLRSGAILLPPDGATQAWTRWVAQGPGGFQTFSGESSTNLKSDRKP